MKKQHADYQEKQKEQNGRETKAARGVNGTGLGRVKRSSSTSIDDDDLGEASPENVPALVGTMDAKGARTCARGETGRGGEGA